MGKISPNSALEGVRGNIGRLVFRKFYGKTVVSFNARQRHEREPTPAEEPQINRFRDAALRARSATPEMCARYRERAKLLNKPAYAVRTGDYMNPPVIETVLLTGYTGLPGEAILVRAKDDFEVKSVKVIIRRPDGEIIEAGLAHPSVDDAELFVYRTREVAARGSEVVVEVAAEDWPGNVGRKECAWMIPR